MAPLLGREGPGAGLFEEALLEESRFIVSMKYLLSGERCDEIL